MKMQELTQLSESQLRTRIQDLMHEYYKWKENVRSGKEKNVAKLQNMRRDIARAKTVLRQFERTPKQH